MNPLRVRLGGVRVVDGEKESLPFINEPPERAGWMPPRARPRLNWADRPVVAGSAASSANTNQPRSAFSGRVRIPNLCLWGPSGSENLALLLFKLGVRENSLVLQLA